jgi:hypothetical protein
MMPLEAEEWTDFTSDIGSRSDGSFTQDRVIRTQQDAFFNKK